MLRGRFLDERANRLVQYVPQMTAATIELWRKVFLRYYNFATVAILLLLLLLLLFIIINYYVDSSQDAAYAF
jgi:uncharacterized integral membrane protein